MEEEAINKIIHAMPDECIKELGTLLSGDYEERQITELLQKYNIDIKKILSTKEVQ